jgi:hypothetical protein
MPALNLTAKLLHHHLLAITNAKDRQAHIKQTLRRTRAAFVDHAGRATGQNHGFGSKVANEIFVHVLKRMDFAIDIAFAQASRDQLRYLRSKINDEKAVMCLMCHTRCLGLCVDSRKRIVEMSRMEVFAAVMSFGWEDYLY